ncbi:hypothetical protein K9B33_17840 [Sphingobium sp. 3R8]|uniref:hypothetical protein n=1 Tax=Sphingobium sp. 3R8 TaxID=2874921 RepID=UPI001CCB96C3|nr:hypothetical protein [Sphingobium sp. 3R8]MBZ9649400.1 hypothetical protein [Sphingobium sp. 3R8]
MDLIGNLKWISGRWVDAHAPSRPSVSLKTLSSRAINDGKLFDRIEAGRPIEIPTYERCIRFLSLACNWPNDTIPIDVLQHLALQNATFVARDVIEAE